MEPLWIIVGCSSRNLMCSWKVIFFFFNSDLLLPSQSILKASLSFTFYKVDTDLQYSLLLEFLYNNFDIPLFIVLLLLFCCCCFVVVVVLFQNWNNLLLYFVNRFFCCSVLELWYFFVNCFRTDLQKGKWLWGRISWDQNSTFSWDRNSICSRGQICLIILIRRSTLWSWDWNPNKHYF
jgi:hypothetical protein